MTLTLTISDLPDDVADRLRARAVRSGRTLEAEVRTLLGAVAGGEAEPGREAWREAVLAARAAFVPLADPKRSVVDELIAERRSEAQRSDAAASTQKHGSG